MPRRVQDIVPSNHRSIRNIPVERNGIAAPVQPVRRISLTPPKPRSASKRPRRWPFVVLGIVVIVAGAGYAASVYFSHATFTIMPRIVPVAVDSTYIAQNVPGKGALVYELAVVQSSLSETVPAVDGPATSIAAKGSVTLYNAYSTQPQRLIAGTRLSDDTGRIYRLTSSVVIPGYTSSAGAVVPGTLVASVVADKPGESYNIAKADLSGNLTIVAYKGTPRYTGMYAKLHSDITGGFVGSKKMVSPSVLASTTVLLQSKLTATLLGKVKETVPEGYLMYDDAYVTTFSPATTGGGDPKSASVTVRATLYGILFKKSELVERLAGDKLSAFESFAYETPGLESLQLTIANKKDFSPEKKNTLIVKLRGNMDLIGSVPVDVLKAKLAGLSLIDTPAVLRSYKPVIDVAASSGQVTPPWARIPDDLERISVKVLTR